jgi:GTP-binding protein
MAADKEFGRKLFSDACEFVAGAPNLDALPSSHLPEVAFLGRSNVGKSSLINALVGRTGLARVSNTPGRTRQINLFQLGDRLMLADLPGYGFAHVSKSESFAWNGLIRAYLGSRRNLRCVVLLIDARRGIMETDQAVMRLLDTAAVPYQLGLTKAELVKPAEKEAVIGTVAEAIESHPAALPTIIATDAKRGSGIAELRKSLAQLAAH